MTHISGSLKWTNAIFLKCDEGDDGLYLTLSDGSIRKMLYKNWEDSFPTTLRKLKTLRSHTPIRFATWSDYDELKWFCDVEQI